MNCVICIALSLLVIRSTQYVLSGRIVIYKVVNLEYMLMNWSSFCCVVCHFDWLLTLTSVLKKQDLWVNLHGIPSMCIHLLALQQPWSHNTVHLWGWLWVSTVKSWKAANLLCYVQCIQCVLRWPILCVFRTVLISLRFLQCRQLIQCTEQNLVQTWFFSSSQYRDLHMFRQESFGEAATGKPVNHEVSK